MLRLCALILGLLGMAGCGHPEAGLDAGSGAARGDLVKAVRSAIASGDRQRAAVLVEEARAAEGASPTVLLAQSWVGRGALAEGDLDTAEAVGRRTYDEVQQALRGRSLDEEPQLPLALGASIELLGNVAVARGARSEALAYLQDEFGRYAQTSIAMRLQKNINLLSLEGTPAPALSTEEHLGTAPPALADLRGQVVLMFFWAHWCSDCKQQAPILVRLRERYGPQGLTVLAPTQRYGYVAGGRDAGPDEEAAYIADVWRDAYGALRDVPVTLDAANHQRYGVSTTPTLVLADRTGTIRLYHPGQMTEEALATAVEQWLPAADAATR